MTIHIYTQGQSAATDRELFGTLGPTITDLELHNLLGMAITSRPGDVWHVMVDADGALRGFALVRPLKSQKSAHIRFLHAPNSGIRPEKLLFSVIKSAQEAGLRALHTNDRAGNLFWSDHGFEQIPGNRRGDFVRWQLNMETTS